MVCGQIKTILAIQGRFETKKVNDCFYNIQNLIVKTLKSVVKMMVNDKHCFQLYGFDIMLDSSLKPWIIEVNGSPSMRANTEADCVLKCGIIDDVLTILDLQQILKGEEDQIGGFDLIFKNDTMKVSQLGPNLSLLGCKNNRIDNMKQLAKKVAQRLIREEEQKKKNQPKQQDSQLAINNKKSFSITKTARQITYNRPTAKLEDINNKSRQNQTLKINVLEAERPKITSTVSTVGANKNWIIRKNSSVKKDTKIQNTTTNEDQVRYEEGQK